MSAKLTSDSVACITFFGYRRALRGDLKFDRFSSNVVSEEFVLRSLRVFPLQTSIYAWSGGLR